MLCNDCEPPSGLVLQDFGVNQTKMKTIQTRLNTFKHLDDVFHVFRWRWFLTVQFLRGVQNNSGCRVCSLTALLCLRDFRSSCALNLLASSWCFSLQLRHSAVLSCLSFSARRLSASASRWAWLAFLLSSSDAIALCLEFTSLQAQSWDYTSQNILFLHSDCREIVLIPCLTSFFSGFYISVKLC